MAERGFEKISTQKDNSCVKIPTRASEHSIGYDVYAPINMLIPAHGDAKIPTGIKIFFPPNEGLFVYPRSSWGIKYGITLANGVGLLESDYYNNPDNEGELIVILHNRRDADFQVQAGDRICQCVFQKVMFANDKVKTKRKGGIGSSGRR
jgi:dUTP pyrophosphatase